MRNRLIVLAMLAPLFLFGCQTAEKIETGVTEIPTEAEVAAQVITPATPLAPATDYCLECHTEQEKLTTLAKPEVKAEGESKGVG